MTLTPLEIRHKEFNRSLRGYQDSEVDEFLDDVTDEFERLSRENASLSARCAEQRCELERYRGIEETLQHTLVSAQRSAKELTTAASAEAQRLVHMAEYDARKIVNQFYADKQALETEIVVLMSLQEEVRFKFQSLLAGYLEQLDEMDLAAKLLPSRGTSLETPQHPAAQGYADRPVASSTLGDLIVAEPWRSTPEPLIPEGREAANAVHTVRAGAPIALLTVTTGEALSSLAPVGENSESGSTPEPPTGPRRSGFRLGRLIMRRQRTARPRGSEDGLGGHGSEEHPEDAVLAVAALSTGDTESD